MWPCNSLSLILYYVYHINICINTSHARGQIKFIMGRSAPKPIIAFVHCFFFVSTLLNSIAYIYGQRTYILESNTVMHRWYVVRIMKEKIKHISSEKYKYIRRKKKCHTQTSNVKKMNYNCIQSNTHMNIVYIFRT